MSVENGREEFIKYLISKISDLSVLDVFQRVSLCRALSSVSGVKFEVPFKLDAEFFRKYMFFQQVITNSSYNLDFLGKDYGVKDILKFDKVLAEKILRLYSAVNDFIAEVVATLKFDDDLIDFSRVEE